MSHLVVGKFPNGRIAFQSRNLRGLINYARKYGITKVELGDSTDRRGLYHAEFGNGVICESDFADPSIMLGFFLGRRTVAMIECDRHVFNQGSAMGRINIPFLSPIGRDVAPCDSDHGSQPLIVTQPNTSLTVPSNHESNTPMPDMALSLENGKHLSIIHSNRPDIVLLGFVGPRGAVSGTVELTKAEALQAADLLKQEADRT
jgi:hypothetical protein